MSEARAYPHPPVRTDWLALVEEDVLEPDLPIIDPHHHLWHDRPSGRYMPEDLFAELAGGHNIVATVFLQCGWMHRDDGPEALRPAGETEAVNAAAVLSATGAYGKARACAGIVGWADLRRPDLEDTLDAHEEVGGGRFRGIRQIAAADPAVLHTYATPVPPGLLRDPAFQRGLQLLGERGLTFDSWSFHTQLPDLLDAARAAPGTRIVIDHVGGPLGCGPWRARHDEVLEAWSAAMQDLAACRNVHVKLGGLAMPVNGFDYHEDARPPGSEQIARDWRPFIEPCIEWFGPERCMFESNFPVDKGMVGYRVLWNAFKRLAEGASIDERSALFHDTAKMFYGLEVSR
jgi:predicted TIM-barrel fold metal-dependent hydrolase